MPRCSKEEHSFTARWIEHLRMRAVAYRPLSKVIRDRRRREEGASVFGAGRSVSRDGVGHDLKLQACNSLALADSPHRVLPLWLHELAQKMAVRVEVILVEASEEHSLADWPDQGRASGRRMICDVKSLLTSLSESAASYATRALEAYVMDDLSDFVLFAGIAIEHAAKAKLARANPAFLAGRDFRSAVALSRASDDVRKLPPGTKTVGAAEALSRAAALEPSLSSHLDAAQEVIALRNGEAHLGLGDENQRRRVLCRVPPSDSGAAAG